MIQRNVANPVATATRHLNEPGPGTRACHRYLTCRRYLDGLVLGRAEAAGISPGVNVSMRQHAKEPSGVVTVCGAPLGTGPLFVNPARGGSSLGISAVHDDATLHHALEIVFAFDAFDAFAVVEEFVPDCELVIGVVDHDDDLVVSPPGECVAVGNLYTHEEKCGLGSPGFTCPAELDAATTKAAPSLAVAAYRAAGCSGFARVDLFVDQRTDGRQRKAPARCHEVVSFSRLGSSAKESIWMCARWTSGWVA
jgi:hypothetical protein